MLPQAFLARCTLVSAALLVDFPPTRGGRGVEMLASSASGRTTEPTIGAAIEGATTLAELLGAASCIPSPHPQFAAPYLADDVHQRRRQRLACNCLQRLSGLLVGSGNAAARRGMLSGSSLACLVHLTACAAAPSCARADGEDDEIDQVSARETVGSLGALATLCGETAAERSFGAAAASPPSVAPMEALRKEAVALAARAEALEPSMDLPQACAARDAVRRLLGPSLPTPRLQARVAALPFEFCFGTVALPAPDEGPGAGAAERAPGDAGAAGPGAHREDGLPSPAHADAVEPLKIPEGGSWWGLAAVGVPRGTDCGRPAAAAELMCLQSLLNEIPFRQEELLTADGRRLAFLLFLHLPTPAACLLPFLLSHPLPPSSPPARLSHATTSCQPTPSGWRVCGGWRQGAGGGLPAPTSCP
eukprot:scaffold4793_cov81-Isochrysis_galbana.AAC.1